MAEITTADSYLYCSKVVDKDTDIRRLESWLLFYDRSKLENKPICIVCCSVVTWTCCEAIRNAKNEPPHEVTDTVETQRTSDCNWKLLSPPLPLKSIRGRCQWSSTMGRTRLQRGDWGPQPIIGSGTQWQQSNAASVMRLMMLCSVLFHQGEDYLLTALLR